MKRILLYWMLFYCSFVAADEYMLRKGTIYYKTEISSVPQKVRAGEKIPSEYVYIRMSDEIDGFLVKDSKGNEYIVV